MTALVPLKTVVFHDGQKLAADLPRNTLDPRYPLCIEHRFACTCREAELAEERSEWRSEFDAARRVFNEVLKDHQTFADTEIAQCKCTGCEIARRTHGMFRSVVQVWQDERAALRAQLAADPDPMTADLTLMRGTR